MHQAKYQNVKLSFDGRDVCFQSEQDLETYVEQHFNIIFPGLTLLARQYTILERRCDLVCYRTANKQAVIIELKNQEDRYSGLHVHEGQ
jgi:RecB family endonuclease NucS